MSTTAQEIRTPQAWIGCLACYNEGRLVGEWFDASIADTVVPYDIHGAHSRADLHDELWVFDHEHIPIQGELDPLTAARWGRLLEKVPEGQYEAFCAWVRNGDYATDSGTELPSLDGFEEHYCGEWGTFLEYVEHLVDDTGILSEVPEEIARYFDYEQYAHDCAFDHTVIDASHGVYVFSN